MTWNPDANDDLKKLGNNLRRLRLERKLDIDTVAAAINITPEMLQKLEDGLYPDCEMLVLFDLAEYYGVSGEELFR